MRPQHEITRPRPLLTDDGQLTEPGWARAPLLDANLERCGGPLWRRLRLKRWDYYGIWTPDLYVSATLSHVGYVGLVFFYIVDLHTGAETEHTLTRPLGRGVHLPRNSDNGDALYDDGRTKVAFAVRSGERRLHVDVPDYDGRGLRIDAVLRQRAGDDSIVVCTPIEHGCFYYNRKINGMPASGTVRWGEREVALEPRSCLGQLDWGRGVWPYRSHWVWASANGFLADGRIVGLNLGGGFGDLSSHTENALFVDGRLHKLGDVRIDFEARDYRRPWRFTDDAGRLELEMTTVSERVAHSDFRLLRTEVHQLFGRYRGRVVTDQGEEIALEGLPGFAEEHWAKW